MSGPGQASVTWIAPSPNGSAPVAAYRVAGTPFLATVETTGTSATIGGLTPGVVYYFSVRAITAAGVSGVAVLSGPVASSAGTIVVLPSVPPVTAPPPPPTGLPLPLPVAIPNPPGTPKPCVPYQWAAETNGVPYNFRTGAPQGVYLWYSRGYWYVRFYNPGRGLVRFSGTIVANASITTSGQYLERGQDILRKAKRSAGFNFGSDYDVDGLLIRASCATQLSFRFFLNGVPLNTSQIFVGSCAANPAGQPLTVVR